MLELDAITTLALACVLLLLGQAIVNNVSILMKLCTCSSNSGLI